MKAFFTALLFVIAGCYLPTAAKTARIPFGKKTIQAPSKQAANMLLNAQALCFVENKGQIKDQQGHARKDIQYKVSGQGMDLFIGSGGMHYQFHKPTGNKKGQAEIYRMDVELARANRNAHVTAEENIAYYENYYLPGQQDAITAHACSRIRYKDVYPGIDWVLYVKDGAVEYDFVLQPGADVKKIKLRYKGAVKLNVDENGDLEASTPLGSIKERSPYAYDGNGQKVKAAFVLHGNELNFKTGQYKGRLTIDPVLKWATYYGGNLGEQCYALTCDTLANIYITGLTFSFNGIATAGAFQTTLSGGGFLVKFDSSGNRLWGTYYGANDGNETRCTEICSDPFGYIYILGQTQSSLGLSTPGSHQPIYGGTQDVFLAKFNYAGYRTWCTYYGGSLGEEPGGVSCDDLGNVYLGGQTSSSTNIATPGAYKTTIVFGFTDGFLVKFDSSGVRQWGTYYGGGVDDEINDICYDRNIGGMYICGTTSSIDSIATPGAYQTTYGGGTGDAFIAKFDDNGALLWGTYYGGSGRDSAVDIAGDEGLIYVCGTTSSTDSIATAGSYQTTYGGGISDAFLTRFTAWGELLWGTYYGGSGQDLGTGLALSNANADIFMAGYTGSQNGIATPGSHQDVYGAGVNDAYLAKFLDLNTATALVWATYYGGTDNETNANVTADHSDNVYLAGGTWSANAIATPSSFKATISPGQSDAFLARFRNCDPPEQPDTIAGNMQLCAGVPQTFTATVSAGATSYVWVLPGGWTGSSTTNTITVTPNDTSGAITVIAINGCDGSLPTGVTVTVLPPLQPPISDNGGQLNTTTYSTYQWYYNGQPIAGATSQNYTATQSGQYYVHVTNGNGCAGNSDTILVWAVAVQQVTMNSEQISVYPNPVKDVLQIDYSGIVGAEMELCDMAGRVLIKQQRSHRMDMRALAGGLYMLRITTPTSKTIKLINKQ